MSNFKGTNGPWKVSNEDPCGLGVDTCNIKGTIGGESICTLWGEPSSVEQKANALLISKAPEMLEMLEIIYQQVDFSFEAFGSDTGIKMEDQIKKLIKSCTEL